MCAKSRFFVASRSVRVPHVEHGIKYEESRIAEKGNHCMKLCHERTSYKASKRTIFDKGIKGIPANEMKAKPSMVCHEDHTMYRTDVHS